MLSGLKILDLTPNLAGPYATLLLADLGAEVLKVEPPGGEPLRQPLDCRRGPSARFEALNRRKKSLTLNLKDDVGRSILINLLAEYDILLEAFSPGVMDRLGLGYAELKKHRPDLIYLALTGYGQDGPWRDKGGHDLNILARSGLLPLTGPAGGDPVIPALNLAGLAGGSTMALLGLLSAVINRQRTGAGCLVDISLLDGLMSFGSFSLAGVFSGEDAPKPSGGLLTGRMPCYNIYRCADGEYMALAALEPKLWQAFCRAVEREDLLGRAQGGEEAVAEVAAIFATRDQAEWTELFDEVECCCNPVLSPQQAALSPQAKARNMTWSMEKKGQPFYQAGAPVRFSTFEAPPPTIAPEAGEHNLEVLTRLGYSEQEVAKLAEAGVI